MKIAFIYCSVLHWFRLWWGFLIPKNFSGVPQSKKISGQSHESQLWPTLDSSNVSVLLLLHHASRQHLHDASLDVQCSLLYGRWLPFWVFCVYNQLVFMLLQRQKMALISETAVDFFFFFLSKTLARSLQFSGNLNCRVLFHFTCGIVATLIGILVELIFNYIVTMHMFHVTARWYL